MKRFLRESLIEAPSSVVGAWHGRRGAFARLVPPWEHITRDDDEPPLEDGMVARLRMHVGPLSLPWDALHQDVSLPHRFVDVQTRGPFAAWRHEHVFDDEGGATRLTDAVELKLPLDPLSRIAEPVVEKMLDRMFRYRHAVTAADVRAHVTLGGAHMRIAMTGASGLVGAALAPFLTTGGHDVVPLVRDGGRAPRGVSWDPLQGTLDAAALGDVDAFVHLAGEPIGDGRWSRETKARIRESRVTGTRRLAETIAALPKRPRVVVSASAIGAYGDRGDEILDEDSGFGRGFLAEVVRDWEAAWAPATEAGVRVVMLRLGVVLSPRGGALKKLLPIFKTGLGGPVGDGRQWMSTIAIDDVLDIVLRALTDERISGPVNAVGPEPLTNAAFSSTLARVLHRPCVARAPAFALRLALGEMAEETVLVSERVVPKKLLHAGHRFRFERVEDALRHVLGR